RPPHPRTAGRPPVLRGTGASSTPSTRRTCQAAGISRWSPAWVLRAATMA
ncbi:unnamed protein product, partial [Prorocentrum cordatum]